MEDAEKKGYSKVMGRKFSLLLFLASGLNLWAESLPEWLIPLQDAFYEQRLTADEVIPLYENTRIAAVIHYSGNALDLALSRCEYYMGRILQDANRNEEARIHYAEGMRLAEKVVGTEPGAVAWTLLAENLSQTCSLGSWTYAIANGLNVEKFAKNALSFDPRSAAAQYLIAARWVYAPAPFHNHRRGIQMMEAILTEGDVENADRFNVYTSIGYAYVQQKKYADARPWLLLSLELYPTNKFVAELLEKK